MYAKSGMHNRTGVKQNGDEQRLRISWVWRVCCGKEGMWGGVFNTVRAYVRDILCALGEDRRIKVGEIKEGVGGRGAKRVEWMA